MEEAEKCISDRNIDWYTFVDGKMVEIWKTFMSFNPASSLHGIYPVEIVIDGHKDL